MSGPLWLASCAFAWVYLYQMDQTRQGLVPAKYKPSVLGYLFGSVMIGSTVWIAVILVWIVVGGSSTAFTSVFQ